MSSLHSDVLLASYLISGLGKMNPIANDSVSMLKKKMEISKKSAFIIFDHFDACLWLVLASTVCMDIVTFLVETEHNS